MKNQTPILLLALIAVVLGGCSKEAANDATLSVQEEQQLADTKATILQWADLFPFLPAGDLGGPSNVLTPGTFFPPTNGGSASLKRGTDYIQFNLHTTGLPEGAYTVWYVIFNEPGDCTEPNPANGACAGGAGADFGLPTTAIVWATGGIVRANGVGNFHNRLYVGERRAPGTQEVLVGGALDSPLENPQGAEVHLIVKYHGPASRNRAVLFAQTHSILGSCGINEGANPLDLGPSFGGVHCFDPQAVVFPAP